MSGKAWEVHTVGIKYSGNKPWSLHVPASVSLYVDVLAKSGRMEVRMTGKAMTDGAIGEIIQVMNMSSKQKLEGIITSTDEIQINL